MMGREFITISKDCFVADIIIGSVASSSTGTGPVDVVGAVPLNVALPLEVGVIVSQGGKVGAVMDITSDSISVATIRYSYGIPASINVTGCDVNTGGSLTGSTIKLKVRSTTLTFGAGV